MEHCKLILYLQNVVLNTEISINLKKNVLVKLMCCLLQETNRWYKLRAGKLDWSILQKVFISLVNTALNWIGWLKTRMRIKREVSWIDESRELLRAWVKDFCLNLKMSYGQILRTIWLKNISRYTYINTCLFLKFGSLQGNFTCTDQGQPI